MSDSSQEPTMEEILASIRRIISEDDAPDASASPAAAPPEEPPPPPRAVAEELPILEDEDFAAPAGAETASFDDDADELELTEKVETHGDLDFYSAPAEPPPAAPEVPDMAGLVSAPAAAAAAAAFGRLSGNMAMPAPGRTLEDVVRELLRPLLQQWLDENLPGIVQRAVDAEVSRIARGG
jgi:cell pole-organizing protein PopZ